MKVDAMDMPIKVLGYERCGNIGDHIQSLAARQHFHCDGIINRDQLASYDGPPCAVVMNGYFYTKPDAEMFPPASDIVPIFFSFHLSNSKGTREFFSRPEQVAYLKRHEPIGCRDTDTRDFLTRLGVAAYFSGCLTTTFPRRSQQPASGRVFIVDCRFEQVIPSALSAQAIRVTHAIDPSLPEPVKIRAAEQLLARYRDEADWVITSRLHCALPCLAMGIPVVFLHDKPADIRFTALQGLTPIQPIHGNKLLMKLSKSYARRIHRGLRWNPAKPAVEARKAEIVASFAEALAAVKQHVRAA